MVAVKVPPKVPIQPWHYTKTICSWDKFVLADPHVCSDPFYFQMVGSLYFFRVMNNIVVSKDVSIFII